MKQANLFESIDTRGNAFPNWPVRATDWTGALQPVFEDETWSKLARFVQEERNRRDVFPAKADLFRAFELTPLKDVKFVILGQDPYHGPGQAHGLSFSVPSGVKPPPSLTNIFRELQDDIGANLPSSGDLTHWAKQGGLLLNTVLTVRSSEANSHRNQGWEWFTDAVIQTVSGQNRHVAFLLWGNPARKKIPLIDADKHCIIQSAHPSPLSAYRGFFGSRPFSRVNQYRRDHGLRPIDWHLT